LQNQQKWPPELAIHLRYGLYSDVLFFHNNAIMNVSVFTNFYFHQQLVLQNVPGSQIAK